MIFVYGWGLIGAAVLLSVLLPMLWKARKGPNLWQDSYFWLLGGVALSAFATGEIMLVRVIQVVTTGQPLLAQPAPLAMAASITAVVAIALKLRSVSIMRPRVGLLSFVACLLWAVLALTI